MDRKFTANNSLYQLDVFLLLGGNIGDVFQTFKKAYSLLEANCGDIVCQSSLYKTAAWGKTDQPDFLNQVVQLKTSLSPIQLLKATQKIETSLGRVRHENWSERKIDIDILYYDDIILHSKKLNIPHLHIQDRLFTLIPLKEIAPKFIHPALGKTNSELLKMCNDNLAVQRVLLS